MRGNRSEYIDPPTKSPAERAWLYIDAIPRAVTGQSGDRSTYKVCCVLLNDFALSDTEAWTLLLEWNRQCEPPWSERDLRAKLLSAKRCEHQKPRGNKLVHALLPLSAPRAQIEKRPNKSGFVAGTLDQLKRLAALRGVGREGLQWATTRELLLFGSWYGQEVFAVTDASGNITELRRLDGQPFPAYGQLSERKSHALAGSKKAWPVGILESKDFPCIALVEGMPDLLAAHYWVLWEQASHYSKTDVRCAPVTMLSSSPSIAEDALPHFKDKHVRIFPHADKAGFKGAQKWQQQIADAGAKRCDIFDITRLKAKDLNDFLGVGPDVYVQFPQLEKIMPDTGL
jgi:hypothetical protein